MERKEARVERREDEVVELKKDGREEFVWEGLESDSRAFRSS